jgi:hypothetical protein
MKQHEREFFIATIRSGKVFINNKSKNIKLVIHPPTIDQVAESCQIYNDSYEHGYVDGMMNEDEMLDWMINSGLWSKEDDEVMESTKKDIEKLKIEIFNARNDSNLKNRIRLYLRAAEKHLLKYISKRNLYHQNTLEGFASTEKLSWIIKNTTYHNNKLYNFNELSLPYVFEEWQNSFLTESQSRELARSEPWKSLWVIKDSAKIKLFNNPKNTELGYNQKNLIIWSQMYDNIQESLDCPPKDIIEDDDMLDGWFIIQAKKRDKERAEQELNNSTSNEKIKNAAEVFVVTKDNNSASRINDMNSIHAQRIKKQRESIIKSKGLLNDHDLPDQRLNIQMQQNNQSIGKFKGG